MVRQYLSTETRRAQLVEVAADLMAERGFYATTMPDIAKATGLSVGGLYRHFASKADLIVALVAEDADELARQLDRLGPFASPSDQLLSLLYMQLNRFAEPYVLPLRAEIMAAASRDPAIAEAAQRHDARWAETYIALVTAAAAPGSLGSRAPHQAVALISTVLDGIAARSAISGGIDPLQTQLIEELLQVILTPQGGPSDG
jgi:AcrR family transcriptional regulator